MANRPPPKIIEFVEPGKQRKEKKAIPLVKRKWVQDKTKSSRQDLEEQEFKSIAREVREFGVTGLSRKEKKKYEDWKAQSLGGKAQKGQKMPYPMLMRQIKRRKEREKEQKEREHAMGIFKKKTDKKQSAPTRASMGRWVDNSAKGLQVSVGKYKAGVQRLSKADLRKITSTKKR
ncbi:40S small subunit processome assembly factor 1-like [Oculina patagonica]